MISIRLRRDSYLPPFLAGYASHIDDGLRLHNKLITCVRVRQEPISRSFEPYIVAIALCDLVSETSPFMCRFSDMAEARWCP